MVLLLGVREYSYRVEGEVLEVSVEGEWGGGGFFV